MAEAADCLDECREKAFCSLSYMDLLTKGKAVSNQNSLFTVFEGRYGSTPLNNPNGIPAVVSTACKRGEKSTSPRSIGGSDSSSTIGTSSSSRRSLLSKKSSFDDSGGDSKKKKFYRPLLLRTYDYPNGDDADSSNHDTESDLAESTSNVKLVEAMAATSAVPGLVDRVKVTIDDEPRSLADGFLCANDPTVLALNEARKLYPGRPIGLVLSIGYDDEDVHFANRAISIARLSHPNLHYQRIAPKHVFEHFNAAETCLKKIAVLEEEAYEYVDESIGVQRVLDVSLDRLFMKRKQEKKKKVGFFLEQQNDDEGDGSKREDEDASFEDDFSKMFESKFDFSNRDYQRRTEERLKILSSQDVSTIVKSKRLQSFKHNEDNQFEDRGVVSFSCCGARALRNQVTKSLDEMVFENKKVLGKQSTTLSYDSFLSKNEQKQHSEQSIPTIAGVVNSEDAKYDEHCHDKIQKVRFTYDLSGVSSDNLVPSSTQTDFTS